MRTHLPAQKVRDVGKASACVQLQPYREGAISPKVKLFLEDISHTTTLSGFGVHGTDPPFLSQNKWSIRAAVLCETISHSYVVEGDPRNINSRSFFNFWCHAEKQLLTFLFETMRSYDLSYEERREAWAIIHVLVSRNLCRDCEAFVLALSSAEGVTIVCRYHSEAFGK